MQLMDQKRYNHACPKLAESNRLDPAPGTLLALALCYENSGKIAKAWAAYGDAAAAAQQAGQKDRERAARERVAALGPMVPKVTVQINALTGQIAGLQVKLDGRELEVAQWNVDIPVDPGKHTIEATAPAYEPVQQAFDCGPGQSTAVPIALKPQKVGAPPIPASQSAPPPVAAAPESNSGSLRTWGFIAGGAGVVAIGLGSVFAIKAMGKNSDSKALCEGNVCTHEGKVLRDDAISAANVGTIGFIAGAVLIGTGATLYILGSKRTETPTVAVGLYDRGVGPQLTGQF